MRRGSALSLLRIAHLPHEYGLARSDGFVADLEQPARILEALDVRRDDLGLGIANEIFDEIQCGDADLVTGRDHLPEAEPAVLRRQVHHRETESAGLRHHADGPRLIVRI